MSGLPTGHTKGNHEPGAGDGQSHLGAPGLVPSAD